MFKILTIVCTIAFANATEEFLQPHITKPPIIKKWNSHHVLEQKTKEEFPHNSSVHPNGIIQNQVTVIKGNNTQQQLMNQHIQEICKSEFKNPSVKWQWSNDKLKLEYINEVIKKYGLSLDSYWGQGIKSIVNAYWICRIKGFKEAEEYTKQEKIYDFFPIIAKQIIGRKLFYNQRISSYLKNNSQYAVPCIMLPDYFITKSIFDNPSPYRSITTLPDLYNLQIPIQKKTEIINQLPLSDNSGYLTIYGAAYILQKKIPFFSNSILCDIANNGCSLSLPTGLKIKIMNHIGCGSSTKKIYMVKHPNGNNMFIIKCLNYNKIHSKMIERSDHIECLNVSNLNLSKIARLPLDRSKYPIMKLAEQVLCYQDTQQRFRFVQILHAGSGKTLLNLEHNHKNNIALLFPVFNKVGEVLKNFHKFTKYPHGDFGVVNILVNSKNYVEIIDNETIIPASNLKLDTINLALCDLIRLYFHEIMWKLQEPNPHAEIENFTILFKHTLDGYAGTDKLLLQKLQEKVAITMSNILDLKTKDLHNKEFWEMPFWKAKMLNNLRDMLIYTKYCQLECNPDHLLFVDQCVQKHIKPTAILTNSIPTEIIQQKPAQIMQQKPVIINNYFKILYPFNLITNKLFKYEQKK